MGKKENLRRQDGYEELPQDKAAAQSGAAAEQLFDNWLEGKLRSAYSSVLDEPIPDDLIQLLHQKLKD